MRVCRDYHNVCFHSGQVRELRGDQRIHHRTPGFNYQQLVDQNRDLKNHTIKKVRHEHPLFLNLVEGNDQINDEFIVLR